MSLREPLGGVVAGPRRVAGVQRRDVLRVGEEGRARRGHEVYNLGKETNEEMN